MESKPPQEAIELLHKLQDVLNDYNLSYRHSFMVVSYLTVAIANEVHMSKDTMLAAIGEAYDIDKGLQTQEMQ